MAQSPMQTLGQLPDGTPLYFADPHQGFSKPGLYIWNGRDNVRIIELRKVRPIHELEGEDAEIPKGANRG